MAFQSLNYEVFFFAFLHCFFLLCHLSSRGKARSNVEHRMKCNLYNFEYMFVSVAFIFNRRDSALSYQYSDAAFRWQISPSIGLGRENEKSS